MDENFGHKETKKSSCRGLVPEDIQSFSKSEADRLIVALEEVAYLLERGYPISPVITLVGGHYQLTARQRLALQRATASPTQCKARQSKLLNVDELSKGKIDIDGFNFIITLEVAFSKGILLSCSDGTVRDLAGLRGTYHPIDKTDMALGVIGRAVKSYGIPEIKFWLDSPVSNSGRLKVKILEHAEAWGIPVQVECVPNPDKVLSNMERVVTADAVILDSCISWFNLASDIIREFIPDSGIIELART